MVSASQLLKWLHKLWESNIDDEALTFLFFRVKLIYVPPDYNCFYILVSECK